MSHPSATPMLLLIGAAVLVVAFGLLRSLPPREPKDSPLPAERPAPSDDGGKGEGAITLTRPLISAQDPIRGPATAKVTIVEFADFRCPHCAEAEREIEEILKIYPNEVRLIWKDLPVTPPSDAGLRAHEAARCAGKQNKFWEYHDTLFVAGGAVTEETLLGATTDLKLDREQWTSCLDSGEMRPAVERTIEEARRLGLTGVPAFFVNGERVETLIVADIKRYLE